MLDGADLCCNAALDIVAFPLESVALGCPPRVEFPLRHLVLLVKNSEAIGAENLSSEEVHRGLMHDFLTDIFGLRVPCLGRRFGTVVHAVDTPVIRIPIPLSGAEH